MDMGADKTDPPSPNGTGPRTGAFSSVKARRSSRWFFVLFSSREAELAVFRPNNVLYVRSMYTSEGLERLPVGWPH